MSRIVAAITAPEETNASVARSRLAELRESAWAVAALILLVHGLWIGAYFAAGHEIRDFIKIGYLDVQRSDASQVIKFDPNYRYPPNHDAANGTGFDGQYYYVALDPANARYYIDTDEASYRYARIVYPMAARALALGQPSLIPYTLLLINWLSVGVGVLILAAWLRRKGMSPWFAAIYGLYPGLLISLQRDLTEPLAYALVVVAIYLFDFGGKRRLLWAALAFAVAALTREVTLIFAAAYAGAVLLRGGARTPWRERIATNWRAAVGFASLAALPLGLYEVFLWRWIGTLSVGGGLALFPVGLIGAGEFQLSRQPPEIIGVVIPAIICGGLAVRALAVGIRQVEIFAFLANWLLLVLMQPGSVYIAYTSIGRAAIGVVLAALICLPCLGQLKLSNRWLAWAPVAMWLSVWPAVLVYGFATGLRVG